MATSTALAPSTVTHRDPKGLKFMSIVENAYNKLGLTEDEAQRVNDTPGLPEHIATFINEHRLLEDFADEEVGSSYKYLSGYQAHPSVEQNIDDMTNELKKLKDLFPELANANVSAEFMEKIANGEVTLPHGMERWTLVPRWQVLAKTYGEAVEKMLAAIDKDRRGKFQNYRKGALGPDRLRQMQKTIGDWDKIAAQQADCDILIVPVQLGLKHRGKSVRRARVTFVNGEFGLGAFAVGITILTHPERLMNYDDLWVDCSGDEYDDPDSDVRWYCYPYFNFHGGEVKFNADRLAIADEYYGSASGVSPQ